MPFCHTSHLGSDSIDPEACDALFPIILNPSPVSTTHDISYGMAKFQPTFAKPMKHHYMNAIIDHRIS